MRGAAADSNRSDGPQELSWEKKFAKVDFVAVLACLRRDHRVSVLADPGETPQQTRKRALATAEGLCADARCG